MADLTKRLVPDGVYDPTAPSDPNISRARSSRLHIDSFRNEQRFMKLQPLPDPHAEPRALPERIFPVTVISSDGREKPTTFGMPIKQVCAMPCSAVSEYAEQGDLQCLFILLCVITGAMRDATGGSCTTVR